jgi:hypothetical protein
MVLREKECLSMLMNKNGKASTIILIVIGILLLSLTGIAIFFFTEENKLRVLAENNLESLKLVEAKLRVDMKETERQKFVLEQKNKEAEEKINNYLDDIELNKALLETSRQENTALKEALEAESKSKEELRGKLTKEISTSQEKMLTFQDQLTKEQEKVEELERSKQDLEKQIAALSAPHSATEVSQANASSIDSQVSAEQVVVENKEENVQLGKIVVEPSEIPEGKVLSVDNENSFIIIDLGQNEGIQEGMKMSVYRKTSYLGDVVISRIQPEMAAADFVPPLTSRKVRKSDRVVVKQ